MSKIEFQKFIMKNLERIEGIYCRIWEGYNIENEKASWLEVYIEYDYDYEIIFSSDDYSSTIKELLRLQKKWITKLSTWVNPNWNIKLISDIQCI